jgi:phosphorylcholine metabolism protein LicD
MKKINNYEAKNPVITFRLHDEIAKKKLFKEAELKNISHNTKARDIVLSFLQGDLVPKQKSIDAELQQARLEKIKLENQKLVLVVKQLQMKVDFGENFQKPISLSGTRLISANVKQIQEDIQSPYDELNNRLQCVDCGRLYTWINQTGFIDQIAEFTNHLKIRHNRELNPLEKDVINNLTFTGSSK